MTVLLVAVGAMVGAPLRYYTDRAVQARRESVLPWGTLAVNVGGSLLLGVLTGGFAAGVVAPGLFAAVGAGFCGALTTYSTFGFETVRLAESGSRRLALLNVTLCVVLGLAAAGLGLGVAAVLWR